MIERLWDHSCDASFVQFSGRNPAICPVFRTEALSRFSRTQGAKEGTSSYRADLEVGYGAKVVLARILQRVQILLKDGINYGDQAGLRSRAGFLVTLIGFVPSSFIT